jgi:hypothetical protein
MEASKADKRTATATVHRTEQERMRMRSVPFLFSLLFQHLPGRASDPINTATRDSSFQRKRRQQAVKAAMQKDDDPRFPHCGLEKETAKMFLPVLCRTSPHPPEEEGSNQKARK